MKNIQVIDGATNCAYSIFEVTEETFSLLFPGRGQDIEFIDDIVARLGEEKAGEILAPVWEKRIEKRDVAGIHGTLFYELEFKKKYYPNKRESDFDDPDIQRGIR